ncbi:hypothetical protein HPB48_011982 [Haemaphysalis longicornis]|uniref:Peptidase M13 N-terminal domain-containing protein n=1 Tax=Haemaphysalis longicornis TaxID=44386 RepID=A0A9J6H3T8_HAELO|nr:hypothetical protein HPB48_011982 [Haemaphysalis longicornis]
MDGRPCDDFYTFVCSRWTSQLPFPLNSSLSTDDDYVAVLENQIYVSLERERQRPSLLQPLKLLHDECMDVANIEHRGLEELNSLLADVSLEGFPFATPIRDDVSVWTVAGRLLRKTGTSALLSVSFASNPANKSEDIVSVRPPELLSASGFVDIAEIVRLYTKAILLTLTIFQKEDIPPEDIMGVAKFVIDLEKPASFWPKSDYMNIDPLSSQPELMEFVKEAFVSAHARTDIPTNLSVWWSGFARDLLDLIRDTHTHIVLNYIGIRLLVQVSPFLPYSEFKDLFNIFVYGKPTAEASRWQLCIRVADKALYPLVHASLFAQVKLLASKASLNHLIRVILDEFRYEIDNSLYFDSNSKSAIRSIISSSALSIIGPSWPENEASLRDYVEKLPEVRATQSGLEIFLAYYQHTFLYFLARGSQGRSHRSTFSTDCWYEVNPRTIHVPLLAFNVTQIIDEGTVNDIQASRVGPRLSRCLFDMLLEEAEYANGTTKQWLSDGTWKNLLSIEACLEGRQDFLRFGRFRDVLAVHVALNVFEKNVSSMEKLAISLPDDRVLSGVQAFFAYLMLQSCKKSEGPRSDGKSPTSEEWNTALRNSDRFRGAFACSRSVASRPTKKCPRSL